VKMRVAIIGTGNIGTDLLVKAMRSKHLECAAFIGRRSDSPGIKKAKALNVQTSTDGIAFIQRYPYLCDLVFDATSADDHLIHAPILERLNKIVVDLTPARIGKMIVPVVNRSELDGVRNVNTVTCGGQASIPIAYALSRIAPIDYIEVVSSIASRSAGPATRRNLDDYIHTTERGLRAFTGAREAKAILNLNPAIPQPDMQTTILARVGGFDLGLYREKLEEVVAALKLYVPGYEIIVPPVIEGDRLVTVIRVRGLGDYLPSYAGNLDIINCAAIAIAEEYARRR